MKYKEIKYITHNLRNVYSYIIIFYIYVMIYNININIKTFVIWLLWYIISYSVIYFFNDFTDYNEDKKDKKRNLYFDIKNKKRYWNIFFLLMLSWNILSYIAIGKWMLLICILYILNYCYSSHNIRLRNKKVLRAITLNLIYITKFILISCYLQIEISHNFPWLIAIFFGVMSAFGIHLYKRHTQPYTMWEYIFWIIFLSIGIANIIQYPQLSWFIIPIFLTGIRIYFYYKNRQIPLWKVQNLYFIYTTIIFILYIIFIIH